MLGFLTFSLSKPDIAFDDKTLSIGRIIEWTVLRRFLRMTILVQMLIFWDKTQKPRAITYWTHHRMLLRLY